MMSIFPAGNTGLRSKTDDVMRNLFGRSQNAAQNSGSPTVLTGPRVPRHSSAWKDLLKYLKTEQGLRILDIGPTSPTNINFLTTLGHGVYMADVVNESLHGNWMSAPDENGVTHFDVEGFLDNNLDFAGREFDVILLWTTLDYVPQDLVAPLIKRLRSSMRPGGRVLTFFHTRNTGPDTSFCRYHVTDNDSIETQETTGYQVQRVYTNRTIEKLFETYSSTKFYLAKDNLYEVIITR
ncbi:MAG TPA: class I SAM-dependent methyltransferase [Acidobacteriaceae bacterium]|nr:class I SAM-dependent methyltransferase [Acidobacteriaceae bacterium]